MKILLNILGILIFFFTKLAGRKDKTEPLSVKFWIKDNFEQLIVVALIDVALMLLLVTGGLKLSFEKLPNIPNWLQVVGDGAACLLIGAFLAYAGYEAYKKIVLDKR
jgi:hypothetical protein